MRGFDLKHIRERSFMINGLTAKWGIGDNRDERYKNPLHAWTISGRADGSEDFSPLLDKMGTGNALTLTGFDGTPGSGFENGYLVFDGVDDEAMSARFRMGKYWTVIGDWEFTEYAYASAGLVKTLSLYVYNENGGAKTLINRTSLPVTHTGMRRFNAICSDGRLYDNTWQLYNDDGRRTVEVSNSAMYIARNGSAYTSMKFKNLAIYEGAPLSEEQCKKAYDWLQTL